MAIAMGQEVTVMGWEDMHICNNWTELSNVLQNVTVTVISNKECNASKGTIGG
jgi:hypothetical protein